MNVKKCPVCKFWHLRSEPHMALVKQRGRRTGWRTLATHKAKKCAMCKCPRWMHYRGGCSGGGTGECLCSGFAVSLNKKRRRHRRR